MVRVIVAVVALVAFPSMARAQESRVYVGGAFNLVTHTHSDREPIGGTTHGANALFGVQVSPRVAIEFEPSFGGRNSWEYTYRPSPSLLARVVASRRDTFFPSSMPRAAKIEGGAWSRLCLCVSVACW